MQIYSTCATCGELLDALDPHITTHPGCPEPEDHASRLTRQFLTAAENDDPEADELAAALDRLDDAPPRLLDAAMLYVTWGWPVFPLRPDSKQPWPHSHGFKDATTDPHLVHKWWMKSPACNIGIATGHTCDVLDVDFKHGAVRVWPDLRDADAMPTCHGIASTPSGGLHVLLLPSGGGNAAAMAGLPGIDYRGLGGYIVAAPSTVDGRGYRWWVKPSPMVRETPSVDAGVAA